MQSHFHQELEELKLLVLHMAALSERAIQKSVQALFERNSDLAEEVMEGDKEINLLEIEVDRQCLRLLALEQPLAKDLRVIIGCLRTAVDLERIGDEAVNIAQRAQFLTTRPPLPPNPAMEQLADTALDMFKSVIAAFVNENEQQALDVCRMDDTADELNVRVLKNLLAYMVNEVPAIERSVQTIIAARCLERAADQATNIAESVIFMLKGVNIKHHCQR